MSIEFRKGFPTAFYVQTSAVRISISPGKQLSVLSFSKLTRVPYVLSDRKRNLCLSQYGVVKAARPTAPLIVTIKSVGRLKCWHLPRDRHVTLVARPALPKIPRLEIRRLHFCKAKKRLFRVLKEANYDINCYFTIILISIVLELGIILRAFGFLWEDPDLILGGNHFGFLRFVCYNYNYLTRQTLFCNLGVL